MSAKWHRSRAWDDRFFPPWAGWAKALLRAFSSIWLAVFLLTLVALYGVLASVPIGLLALIPTLLVYGATLVGALVLVGAAPTTFLRRIALGRASRPARFAVTFLAGLALSILGAWLWLEFLWPRFAWNPETRAGFRLFAPFVDRHAATTLRRLPILEMSELEFYAWWPLRVILLLFVLNLVVATLRRIEFRFVNLGVLTVHTGIVTIALGSLCYTALKHEGDTILVAGPPGSSGGVPVASYFDHIDVALRLRQDDRIWEQRRLTGAPRYNDYNTPWSARSLDVAVDGSAGFVDPDIDLRLAGYAVYADLSHRWVEAPPPVDAPAHPAVIVELRSALPAEGDSPDPAAPSRTVARATLPAPSPGHRLASVQDVLAVEHVPAEHAARWDALTAPFPQPGEHALWLTLPGAAPELVVVQAGDTILRSGLRIDVEDLTPEPPFPIITPGFENATSPVATLRITTPDGESFQRFVYHRFPELDQDVTGTRDDGRPERRAADRSIVGVDLIDATMWQVYLFADGRACVRRPGGDVAVIERIPVGEALALAPMVDLVVAERWEHSEEIEEPRNVPEHDRNRAMIGLHGHAALAVRVESPPATPGGPPWSRTLWLPFMRYASAGMPGERSVTLPDGRRLTLAFTRLERPLPGIALALVDFEMVPYPHSEAPRDFRSVIRVLDADRGEQYDARTSLNTPLIHRAPFRGREDAPAIANFLARMVSLLIPNQYKFSQAGWDSEGWRRSKEQAALGLTDRPRAQFTILGVGNNPGIYIIAAGGVMMGVGIPWAFYVKPWILRRRKARIQRELAASPPPPTPRPPVRAGAEGREPVGAST